MTPKTAYGIFDGSTLIEVTGTGQLAIYYAMDDARTALPAVQRGFSGAEPLTIREVSLKIEATPAQRTQKAKA